MARSDVAGGSAAIGRRSGKCKWFNVVKGYGFITPDDGDQDVFVHQTVIQMQGFRSLGEGEEVLFESRTSGKGVEATLVCSKNGGDCRGSDRRPISRKKFRKIRCYNCGDFANHIAAKCPHGPLPKRCHFCKAEDHLIADCPCRKPGDSNDSTGNEQDGDSSSSPQPPPQPAPTASSSAHPPSASTSSAALSSSQRVGGAPRASSSSPRQQQQPPTSSSRDSGVTSSSKSTEGKS